ncbi:DUF724 domain-containing protein 6-like isoform X2 [Tripterygium wilfordii]|uniref:DUF724 domain-containing protein 6-like isoform X2 n=1 Tax=Tripterygium wilfordii TaxID=458696 RepID=UPI0018F84704|nr:DUF724 domain-containing protein 6-like isoform X2 [Tripterygium wilfordii]
MVGFDSDQRLLFGKGTKVEVSNDEEGFKGAWYRASILESSPKSVYKKKKKVLVEYEALLMEDGSSPLVEHVDPAHIRPLPPEEESGCRVFELNEIVDAGYRDGWWVGTVKKVLEGSRYRVYFDNPPDVIDFDGRDLRLHWNWLLGNWFRPVKEQVADSIFSSGAAVEVNPDSPSLCDVWFPAIVIKDYGNDNFLVKYNTEYGEDVDAVKIYVDLLHIRPMPPCYLDRSYELLEKVDTSYGIGWRAGVITKVLAGGRYIVFFKQVNEDKEFSHSDIRPHLEWIDGKWISASKEIFVVPDCLEQSCDALNSNCNSEVVLQLESTGASHNSEVAVVLEMAGAFRNSQVDAQLEMTGAFKYHAEDENPRSTSVESKLMEQPAAGSENSPSYCLPASQKRFRIAAPNRYYMHSQPRKDPMQEDYEEIPLSRALKLKKSPLEMLTKDTTHGFTTPNKGGSVKRFSRSPAVVSWDFSQPKSSFSENNVVSQAKYQKIHSATRKKRAVKSKSNITPVSVAGKRNRKRHIASMDMNEDSAKVNDPGVPLICASKAEGIRDLQAENSSQLQSKEPLKLKMDLNEKKNNQAGDKSAVLVLKINPQKSMGGSQKRKRGRPCKLVVSEPNIKEAGEVQQGAGDDIRETEAEDCVFSEVIVPMLQQVDSIDSPGAPVLGIAEVSQEDGTRKEVDIAITAVSDDITDGDQPLSSWFGGNHSSTSFDELRLSSGRVDNGGRERRERQLNGAPESSPFVTVDDSVPYSTACSPFVKRSSVWQTIESMEVFRILPQEPHFYPLAECKEEHREGSAIGMMVTFASLFEKISTLQIDYPSSIFNRTLETLDDLEKYGFDVLGLKDRVRQLLSMKDGHVQLLNGSRDFEKELTVHIQETTRLDEETRETERKLSELQKQLEAIKSKKVVKDDMIAKLQSEMEAANSCVQNIRSDFQKQATASWKLP